MKNGVTLSKKHLALALAIAFTVGFGARHSINLVSTDKVPDRDQADLDLEPSGSDDLDLGPTEGVMSDGFAAQGSRFGGNPNEILLELGVSVETMIMAKQIESMTGKKVDIVRLHHVVQQDPDLVKLAAPRLRDHVLKD